MRAIGRKGWAWVAGGLFLGLALFGVGRAVAPSRREENLVVPRADLGRIQFAFNSADLLPGAYPVLEAVARAVLATRNLAPWSATVYLRPVVIEGHTDSVGTPAYNRALALERARAVQEVLYSLGVPAHIMATVGHGPDLPIATNATDEGRAQNRRVEIRWADGEA